MFFLCVWHTDTRHFLPSACACSWHLEVISQKHKSNWFMKQKPSAVLFLSKLRERGRPVEQKKACRYRQIYTHRRQSASVDVLKRLSTFFAALVLSTFWSSELLSVVSKVNLGNSLRRWKFSSSSLFQPLARFNFSWKVRSRSVSQLSIRTSEQLANRFLLGGGVLQAFIKAGICQTFCFPSSIVGGRWRDPLAEVNDYQSESGWKTQHLQLLSFRSQVWKRGFGEENIGTSWNRHNFAPSGHFSNPFISGISYRVLYARSSPLFLFFPQFSAVSASNISVSSVCVDKTSKNSTRLNTSYPWPCLSRLFLVCYLYSWAWQEKWS